MQCPSQARYLLLLGIYVFGFTAKGIARSQNDDSACCQISTKLVVLHISIEVKCTNLYFQTFGINFQKKVNRLSIIIFDGLYPTVYCKDVHTMIGCVYGWSFICHNRMIGAPFRATVAVAWLCMENISIYTLYVTLFVKSCSDKTKSFLFKGTFSLKVEIFLANHSLMKKMWLWDYYKNFRITTEKVPKSIKNQP